MATYWENSCSFGLRYVSWYKYLIVSLVFSHLGFWSGNLFLIAPFPDLCLLVPFYQMASSLRRCIWPCLINDGDSLLLFCRKMDVPSIAKRVGDHKKNSCHGKVHAYNDLMFGLPL